MNCPNCHQPLDAGATFCGNCGQQLMPAPAAPTPGVVVANPVVNPSPTMQPLTTQPQQSFSPGAAAPTVQTPPPQTFGNPQAQPQPFVGQAYANTPASMPMYATPVAHPGHTKGMIAIVLGVLGIVGGLFITFIGIVLGLAGIILSTMMPRGASKSLKVTAIVLSILASLVGLGGIVYNMSHYNDTKASGRSSTNHVSEAGGSTKTDPTTFSTDCYTLTLPTHFNRSTSSDGSVSCALDIYSGSTEDTSNDYATLYGISNSTVNASNFNSASKKVAGSFGDQLAAGGVTITGSKEHTGTFAGSPAYFMDFTATQDGQTLTGTLVTILHPSAKDVNVFVLGWFSKDGPINQKTIEDGFSWK